MGIIITYLTTWLEVSNIRFLTIETYEVLFLFAQSILNDIICVNYYKLSLGGGGHLAAMAAANMDGGGGGLVLGLGNGGNFCSP